jgi:hypothetical protein
VKAWQIRNTVKKVHYPYFFHIITFPSLFSFVKAIRIIGRGGGRGRRWLRV